MFRLRRKLLWFSGILVGSCLNIGLIGPIRPISPILSPPHVHFSVDAAIATVMFVIQT